jgi:hypothetical protein
MSETTNEPIKMTHPDLPGQEITVVNPAGVPIHRQAGWRTEDETPKTAGKPAAKSEEK